MSAALPATIASCQTQASQGEMFKNGTIQLLLAVNAVIMIYPLFVMVMSSFKTNAEIFSSPLTLPTHFSTANIEKVDADQFRALPRQRSA